MNESNEEIKNFFHYFFYFGIKTQYLPLLCYTEIQKFFSCRSELDNFLFTVAKRCCFCCLFVNVSFVRRQDDLRMFKRQFSSNPIAKNSVSFLRTYKSRWTISQTTEGFAGVNIVQQFLAGVF